MKDTFRIIKEGTITIGVGGTISVEGFHIEGKLIDLGALARTRLVEALKNLDGETHEHVQPPPR